MIVLVSKNNTEEKKRFLIPKNNTYNCKNWVEITVDNIRKEFIAKKVGADITKGDEWEEKENYTFPSSLLTEFLRKDYEETD
jgi:hypothetical protein